MGLLSTIENSAFSTWVREGSSVFGYYGFLFLHTAGLAILVGLNVMVDLRLLGLGRRIPVGPLDRLFPVMWIGFWITAISGTVLLAADATAKFTSPLFGVKMLLIAFAVADLIVIRVIVFRSADVRPIPPMARLLAAASVALWFGATAAGRVMAFVGTVPGGR